MTTTRDAVAQAEDLADNTTPDSSSIVILDATRDDINTWIKVRQSQPRKVEKHE